MYRNLINPYSIIEKSNFKQRWSDKDLSVFCCLFGTNIGRPQCLFKEPEMSTNLAL